MSDVFAIVSDPLFDSSDLSAVTDPLLSLALLYVPDVSPSHIFFPPVQILGLVTHPQGDP